MPVIAEIFSPEILIIVAVVFVLLFGGSKLPELARALGSAKNEFEKASKTTDTSRTTDTSTTTSDESSATDES